MNLSTKASYHLAKQLIQRFKTEDRRGLPTNHPTCHPSRLGKENPTWHRSPSHASWLLMVYGSERLEPRVYGTSLA